MGVRRSGFSRSEVASRTRVYYPYQRWAADIAFTVDPKVASDWVKPLESPRRYFCETLGPFPPSLRRPPKSEDRRQQICRPPPLGWISLSQSLKLWFGEEVGGWRRLPPKLARRCRHKL